MASNENSAESTNQVTPGAEPFQVDAGSIGVLLCHGFSGSVAAMRPWAQFLADRQFSVSAPLLPGHGTRWRDLNATSWHDWYAALESAFNDLLSRCDRVAVGGLSMGGALAIRLAQRRPADVAALVVVNPAVATKRLDARFVPLISRVLPAVGPIAGDINRPGQDEVGYNRTPLRAMATMMRQWEPLIADLPEVTAPLLYFRSIADHVVDDSSTTLIRDGVSSQVNELVMLRRSFHVATLDYDADLIFEQSAHFIADHTT